MMRKTFQTLKVRYNVFTFHQLIMYKQNYSTKVSFTPKSISDLSLKNNYGGLKNIKYLIH